MGSFQSDVPSARRYLLLGEKWSENITNDKSSYELLVNLIRLSNGIGLTVIIEGIEQAEQVRLLQKFPDVLIKGSIVGKNISSDDL